MDTQDTSDDPKNRTAKTLNGRLPLEDNFDLDDSVNVFIVENKSWCQEETENWWVGKSRRPGFAQKVVKFV